MSDEEIIEAKRKEITRLHQVCQAKDRAIREIIEGIDNQPWCGMADQDILILRVELKEKLNAIIG